MGFGQQSWIPAHSPPRCRARSCCHPARPWGSSRPHHHRIAGEMEVCKERQLPALGPCHGAVHPASSGKSCTHPRGAPSLPPVLLDTQIPVGVLMRVSSLAGVPGAIPGGGVPGAGFFPGKGTWAVWGHHRDGQALGGAPRAPLSPAEQDQGAGTPCPGRLQHHGMGTGLYQPYAGGHQPRAGISTALATRGKGPG